MYKFFPLNYKVLGFFSKFQLLALLFALTLIFEGTHCAARETGRETGGGGAYVCKDNKGEYETTFLDLWEAENRWSITPKETNISFHNSPSFSVEFGNLVFFGEYREEFYDTLISLYLQRTRSYGSPHWFPQVAFDFWLSVKSKGIVAVDDSLDAPKDAATTPPDNCKFVGVFSWEDNKGKKIQLKVNSTNFFKLRSETQRIAGFLHEVVYKTIRAYLKNEATIKDSKVVRDLVGCVVYDSKTCNHFDESIFKEINSPAPVDIHR